MAQSTEQFAAKHLVKPQSVLSRVCRTGHYFGVRPTKLQNGRLAWPDDATGTTELPTERKAA
jgi:hypothetical protein